MILNNCIILSWLPRSDSQYADNHRNDKKHVRLSIRYVSAKHENGRDGHHREQCGCLLCAVCRVRRLFRTLVTWRRRSSRTCRKTFAPNVQFYLRFILEPTMGTSLEWMFSRMTKTPFMLHGTSHCVCSQHKHKKVSLSGWGMPQALVVRSYRLLIVSTS